MRRFPIAGEGDVGSVRRSVEQIATQIGFGDQAVAELNIVVSELATNLVVHHAIEGELVVAEISDCNGRGIEIASRDLGPGIRDLAAALEDHSSTDSMGCGLGAVRRLTDEFDVCSQLSLSDPRTPTTDAGGTVVVTRKWLVESQRPSRFSYSAHSRPCRGETSNGDAFFVSEERDGLFVAVADGLGHGEEAGKASQAAIHHIAQNRWRSFDRLLTDLHHALRKTRGAAVTLVHVRLSDRTLIHAGAGNVEARVYPRCNSVLVPRAGVVGCGAPPRVRINEVPWPTGATLIVYSDGLSGRWDMDEVPELGNHHVTILGHLLMDQHARSHDDATVVVARERAP